LETVGVGRGTNKIVTVGRAQKVFLALDVRKSPAGKLEICVLAVSFVSFGIKTVQDILASYAS
jgi:hypothetical protein